MTFGSKVGSIGDLKKKLAKSTGAFIQYIPKESDGTITGRFITEPDEWVSFKEVFDEVRRKSYPVPEEGMPGYPGPEDRVSNRYLANFVITARSDGKAPDDKVVPLQLGKDIANQLVIMYEKNGTMMDRDFELGRSGSGLDTTYYMIPEGPTPRKLDKYTLLDLEQVLEDTYMSVWGDHTQTQAIASKAAKSRVTAGVAAKRRAQVQEVEDEPEDEELDLDGLAKLADDEDDADAAEALTTLCDEQGIDPNDYDTWADVAAALAEEGAEEPEEDEPEDEEEAEYWTEEELSSKTIGELRAIAREMDPPVTTKGLSKPQLIAAILNDTEF